jgi:CBS domain-containing protein
VPEAELRAFREAFSGALDRFGFPPCPGDVMVRNPLWSQGVDGFVGQLGAWVFARTPEAAMNIAIFFDAVAVAGDPAPLVRAKAALGELLRGERALLAHFAHLIETVPTPNLGVLSQIMHTVGVGPDALDLKRAGIFPIVHGVRALAIDRGADAPSTAERIRALVEARVLEPGFGEELTSALRLFMEFRLRSQLDAMRRGRRDEEAILSLEGLNPGDRDILRDSLRIVRQFREFIHVRFNLAAF